MIRYKLNAILGMEAPGQLPGILSLGLRAILMSRSDVRAEPFYHGCHVPIPQTDEEDAMNIRNDRANSPMNINRIQMLRLGA